MRLKVRRLPVFDLPRRDCFDRALWHRKACPGIHAGTPSLVVQAAVALALWIVARRRCAPFGAAG